MKNEEKTARFANDHSASDAWRLSKPGTALFVEGQYVGERSEDDIPLDSSLSEAICRYRRHSSQGVSREVANCADSN